MPKKVRFIDLISIIPAGEVIYFYIPIDDQEEKHLRKGWYKWLDVFVRDSALMNYVVTELANGNGCLNIDIRKEVADG